MSKAKGRCLAEDPKRHLAVLREWLDHSCGATDFARAVSFFEEQADKYERQKSKLAKAEKRLVRLYAVLAKQEASLPKHNPSQNLVPQRAHRESRAK